MNVEWVIYPQNICESKSLHEEHGRELGRLVPGYVNCYTCEYFARISWGHMLGVRAEKGPLAEGMWFPTKTRENS